MDPRIDQILAIVKALRADLQAMRAGDRPDFDPTVSWVPKDKGFEEFKGKTFSECPAPLLDELHAAYANFSEKSTAEGKTLKNGKPAAPWEKKLSDTAHAWAKFNRASKPAAQGSDELPF